MSFHVPEAYRITRGALASSAAQGNKGAFLIPAKMGTRTLFIIASDGKGWEHVSVHAITQHGDMLPRWAEMCRVKNLFWDSEDWVVQFHPDEREYVNNHATTLHLWRPTDAPMPTPPSVLVGVKGKSPAEAEAQAMANLKRGRA